jgi:hypothetical protein
MAEVLLRWYVYLLMAALVGWVVLVISLILRWAARATCAVERRSR